MGSQRFLEDGGIKVVVVNFEALPSTEVLDFLY
jgi:hypothetical protein